MSQSTKKPKFNIIKSESEPVPVPEETIIETEVVQQHNKGTGAGGVNTNKNGIPYEEITDLDDKIIIIKQNKFSKTIQFVGNKKTLIKTKQANFFKCMKDEINTDIKKAHGCKNPDECYIDKELKKIFIIEKKFQKRSGSVCEKIQTGDFKLWQYSRTFPNYTIIYLYCLSDWFKKNCIAELEYLDFKNIHYFWGNSKTYKDDIINFIINYK
tara:strand:- start:598 stop:1233 length:636 start_codon:yes stop_codon:yes gene_type:complete